MHNRSFNIFTATLVLFFFLATPVIAFAAPLNGGYGTNDFAQGAIFGSLLSGGARGPVGGQNQGAGPQIGQGLSLAGMLTGNIGLMIVGQMMSMLGGLAGGATPQQGAVDEQYVGQGQGFGNGGGAGYGAFDPYYTAPVTQQPTVAACTSSIFIVTDTTVTPNVTKPYPDTVSIVKDGCVLAVNADTAPHNVEVKKQGQVAISNNEAITGSSSHIFRFSAKNTYTLCVDSVATACTTVTVQ